MHCPASTVRVGIWPVNTCSMQRQRARRGAASRRPCPRRARRSRPSPRARTAARRRSRRRRRPARGRWPRPAARARCGRSAAPRVDDAPAPRRAGSCAGTAAFRVSHWRSCCTTWPSSGMISRVIARRTASSEPGRTKIAGAPDGAGRGAAHHRGRADLLEAEHAEQLAEAVEALLEQPVDASNVPSREVMPVPPVVMTARVAGWRAAPDVRRRPAPARRARWRAR